MNDRVAPAEDPVIRLGLLMESAQTHQRLAENQLDALRGHTRELDAVVREAIRTTLVQELQELNQEMVRAAAAMRKVSRQANLRATLLGLAPALLCTLLSLGAARWLLPSESSLAILRAQESKLTANVEALAQRGGRVAWRQCGERLRLCVRIDRSAPAYGQHAEYVVLDGY
jgi:hypothetical protein